jgi:hypothetical protein
LFSLSCYFQLLFSIDKLACSLLATSGFYLISYGTTWSLFNLCLQSLANVR